MTVSGILSYVTFSPGRGDGLLNCSILQTNNSYQILANEEKSEMTWNGRKVAFGELMKLLAESGARVLVSLEPSPERYMAALRADFK